MGTSQSPILNLEGITYRYPGQENNAVDALDLRFFPGDRIGIVAPNGSGKTTLFHIIMGLIKPDAGRISIFGKTVSTEKDFQTVRQKIGLLFQDADDQLFCPTVLEDVAFGPLNLGKSPAEARKLALNTLMRLGMEGFEDRITFKLSGGEKRMVSLATVLSMEPSVLLLDEPTTGLDAKTKSTLIEVLNQLKIAYIVISHEFDFITAVTKNIYSMENGKIMMDEELHVHHHHHVHKHGMKPHKHE